MMIDMTIMYVCVLYFFIKHEFERIIRNLFFFIFLCKEFFFSFIIIVSWPFLHRETHIYTQYIYYLHISKKVERKRGIGPNCGNFGCQSKKKILDSQWWWWWQWIIITITILSCLPVEYICSWITKLIIIIIINNNQHLFNRYYPEKIFRAKKKEKKKFYDLSIDFFVLLFLNNIIKDRLSLSLVYQNCCFMMMINHYSIVVRSFHFIQSFFSSFLIQTVRLSVRADNRDGN